MSAKQMGLVWDYQFTHAEQSIMLALADHADHEGGEIYPSMGRIAWKTGYSRRHTIRVVKDLRERGVLIRVREAEPENHRPAEYRIDWSRADEKPPFIPSDRMSPGTPPGDTGVTGGGDTGVTGGGDIAMSPEPSVKNRQLKPSNNNTPGVGTAAKAYENEIGNLTALIADRIGDAVDEFSAEWVIDAIHIAAENNIRKWSYVDGILKRWRAEGRYSDKRSTKGQDDDPVYQANEFGEY